MSKRSRRNRRQARPVVNRSLRSQRMALDASVAAGFLGTGHTGDRDYYTVLGYPKELEFEHFFGRYEREHIAARIVDFPPEETWRDTVDIADGRDKEAVDTTPFVEEFNRMAKRLRLWHYCQRADKLAGIGRFGVLLIGTTGDGDLEQPVERLTSPDDILYVRPYSEYSVEVATLIEDAGNERYGLPEYYSISMSTNLHGRESVKTRVHWSRIIHVAEGLLENEVFGRPRLQRVFNLLDDLMKIVGGSAEATWKLMRKGFVLDVDADAQLSDTDAAALEDQIDEYDHGLRRFLKTRGMNVMDLGSEVVDPSGPFALIIDLIAGATGIPQRILLGSERGELASSQDASSWAGRIADRRKNWAEPIILRAFIDRLVSWGALPAPTNGEYEVRWRPLFEMSEAERADLANTWAHAAQVMSSVAGTQAVTVEEWRGEFTPFSAERPQVLPVGRAEEETSVQVDTRGLPPGTGESDSG